MVENVIFLHDLLGRPLPLRVDAMEFRRSVDPKLGDNPAGHTVIRTSSGGYLEVSETEAQIEALIKAL